MKYSRNPVSGRVEIYTDEGVFVGHVSTMGDAFSNESAEDGGPGSGNFGHKGRPGKVGGSGKGGGKQYRGGRADIGYYNSRKDWLNGLQGERQHEAVRYIAETKKDLNAKLAAKKKIEDLFKSGMLTAGEAEDRIKKAKLDNIQEGMTPEEYIMRNGNANETRYLLIMAKEARSWDETKDRLLDDNLSDEEKAIYKALTEKYDDWDKIYGTSERWKGLLTQEQLEAKALGLVDFDVDVPDEIKYRLGVKERPVPKVKIPQSLDENNAWIDDLPQEKKDYILGIVRGLGANPQAFGGDIAMNYAENRLMGRIWGGLSVDKDLPLQYGQYLEIKDNILGANYYKRCESPFGETIGNLNKRASEAVKSFMETLADEQKENNPTISVSAHGDVLETGFLMDKSVSMADKAMYLQLKSIALGQETHAVHQDTLAEELEKYTARRKQLREEEKEFSVKRKNFKQDRAKRQEEYSKAASASEVGELMRKSGMFRNGSKAIFKKACLECAQEAAKSYENVMDKYPFLIGQISGIDESETSENSMTYASCSMSYGGIVHLNASDKYFGNINHLLAHYEDDVRRGYHPVGTNGTSVVTHEIGHALDGFLSQRGVNGSKLYSSDANAFSGILRRSVLKSLKMTKSMVASELSKYAEKNAYEWFAECFAEGMTSANPRPMAKEMMRQLDEILVKEGLINA